MGTMYESKLSARRWIAYDLPGNVGWIVWIVCLILLLTQGVTWFTLLAMIPAVFMLPPVIL